MTRNDFELDKEHTEEEKLDEIDKIGWKWFESLSMLSLEPWPWQKDVRVDSSLVCVKVRKGNLHPFLEMEVANRRRENL